MEANLTPAEALKVFRERAGLTQFEAQIKLGVHAANVLCHIENGKRIPDAKLARKIETLFGIPADLWAEKVAA